MEGQTKCLRYTGNAKFGKITTEFVFVLSCVSGLDKKTSSSEELDIRVGGMMEARLAGALQAWEKALKDARTAKIVLCGGRGKDFPPLPESLSSTMNRYLNIKGVPSSGVILEEPWSLNTVESGAYASYLLDKLGLCPIRKAVIVTHQFHMARALKVFRYFFPQTEFACLDVVERGVCCLLERQQREKECMNSLDKALSCFTVPFYPSPEELLVRSRELIFVHQKDSVFHLKGRCLNVSPSVLSVNEATIGSLKALVRGSNNDCVVFFGSSAGTAISDNITLLDCIGAEICRRSQNKNSAQAVQVTFVIQRCRSVVFSNLIALANGFCVNSVPHFPEAFKRLTGEVHNSQLILVAQNRCEKTCSSSSLLLALAKRITQQERVNCCSDMLQLPCYDDMKTERICTVQEFQSLYKGAYQLLQEPNRKLYVRDVQSPVKVFGDIHGHFHELMGLFKSFGFPSTTLGGDIDTTTYIFNGDFVDRGPHDIEVLALLFSMAILHPYRIVLLRGNHEIPSVNSRYGLLRHCIELCEDERQGETIWKELNVVFSCLPLACVVDDEVLVVHGGIGDGAWTLNDLRNIRLPLEESDILRNLHLLNLLWSDPVASDAITNPCDSIERGGGGIMCFTATQVGKFCDINKLKLVVRSHQCVMAGYEFFAGGRMLTVFSAANYMNSGNKASIVVLAQENKILRCSIKVFGFL